MIVGRADRIGIHTQHFHTGEHRFQLLLDLLGAGSDKGQLASAFRAGIGQRFRMAAVMAHHAPVGRMIGQVNRTAWAGRNLSTFAAGQHTRGATAVQKKNALLSPAQVVLQFHTKQGTNVRSIPGTQFPLHIGNKHLGQCVLVVTPVQLEQMVGSLFGKEHGLHRRGGRTQKQQCVAVCTAVLCHIAGMIPGHVFRLIAVLLLLIQNDQPQILQRSKHGRPGPQHHSGPSGAHTLPLVVPFPRAKAAVEHGHLIPKVRSKDA